MDLLASFLSWGGCFFLLIGLKLIGEKEISGFYVALVAEIMWITWGLMTASYALVAMSAVITVMYARAIFLWKEPPAEKLFEEDDHQW